MRLQEFLKMYERAVANLRKLILRWPHLPPEVRSHSVEALSTVLAERAFMAHRYREQRNNEALRSIAAIDEKVLLNSGLISQSMGIRLEAFFASEGATFAFAGDLTASSVVVEAGFDAAA